MVPREDRGAQDSRRLVFRAELPDDRLGEDPEVRAQAMDRGGSNSTGIAKGNYQGGAVCVKDGGSGSGSPCPSLLAMTAPSDDDPLYRVAYCTAARPTRSRATISFMMPAVPSPISRPITSRIRC